MEKLMHNISFSIIGAASGLTGLLSLGRCSGNVCTSCYGCAGAGAGVVLLLVFNKFRQSRKEKNHGMA